MKRAELSTKFESYFKVPRPPNPPLCHFFTSRCDLVAHTSSSGFSHAPIVRRTSK